MSQALSRPLPLVAASSPHLHHGCRPKAAAAYAPFLLRAATESDAKDTSQAPQKLSIHNRATIPPCRHHHGRLPCLFPPSAGRIPSLFPSPTKAMSLPPLSQLPRSTTPPHPRPPAPPLRSSCPLTVARSRRCFTHAIADHGVLQHRWLCRLFSAVHRLKPPWPPFLFSISPIPLLPTRIDPKLSASLLPHLLPRKHHRLPLPPFIHGSAHSFFTHAESLLMAAHASKPIGSPCHYHEPRLLLLPSFPNLLLATMVPYGLMLNRHPLSQSHPWLPPASCHFPSPFLLPITTISTFGLLLSSSTHCSKPQAIQPPYIFFPCTDHHCSSPPCCRLCIIPSSSHRGRPSLLDHPALQTLKLCGGRSPRIPESQDQTQLVGTPEAPE